jgi:tetratricopeptide (TPR) repeat protein
LSALFFHKQNKNLARSSVVVLVLGIICVIALFSAKETDFIKNRPMLARVTEVVEFWEIGSIRERVLNWQIALTAFKEKPIFGYGPENFGTAFNKYYDYRIGRGDPWFDRTHNQIIEQLATGGVVLFSFFVFFLSSVYYVIFKISKKEKILSFVLASVFSAYIIQGVFLFDTLPVYLGLFPFLAFIVALQQTPINADKKPPINADKKVFKNIALSVVGILCVFGIYTTVLVPYMANASAFQVLAATSNGYYKEAKPFAERAFSIKSPYTFWEIRKRIGWVFLGILEQEKTFTQKEIDEIGEFYDFLTPELKKFVENRPFDPQIYYVLARTYRLGSEKLGKNDLEKAKIVLEKAFNYSDLRIEYYNEIAHVLLAEGKFKEGENLLRDYVKRVSSFDYFPSLIMGHYYYVAEEYDLAMENYKIAKDFGYNFNEDPGEYSRYIAVAEQTKEYQEIVEMAKDRLGKYGPDADTYFNIALGYYYLEEKEEARDFFQKALELDPEQYQQYSHFFETE